MKFDWKRDERVRQVLVAVVILFVLALGIMGLIIGWRRVPGLAGEWLGMIAGIVSTPFLLEATFVILGIILVIALNTWRRHRDGDELVYLEEVEGPDVPADLPDHARWALFKEPPLDAELPDAISQAEGALAIGDIELAGSLLADLDPASLSSVPALRVRRDLALACGREELARELSARLAGRGES